MEIEKHPGLRVMQSFCIMRVTMSYMGSLEQLWMQHICKWYYATGAGRVQTSIRLVWPTYYFTANCDT